MQFTTQFNFKNLLALTLIVSLLGCSTMSDDPERIEIKDPGPKTQTFSSPFLEVWKASLITIGKYPLKAYDEESGVIETDYIKGDEAWIPPHKKKYIRGGYKYKINIRVIKGTSKETKVVILKQPEHQKDFFSDSEKQVTDGLEELAILYRIERELALSQALQKVKRN